MHAAIKEKATLMIRRLSPGGPGVFICGLHIGSQLLDKVCKFSDARDERGDVIKDGVVAELFGDGPYGTGGRERFVEGDEVFCLRDCRCHWFFRNLGPQLVSTGAVEGEIYDVFPCSQRFYNDFWLMGDG